MKPIRVLALSLLLLQTLTSCVFKEPVFTTGFGAADPGLAGVWATDGEGGDPRKIEFAVFLPLDDSRWVLHYPTNEKDGFYFEARPLGLRDRDVLQLRVLGTMKAGPAKPDETNYTLLWLEKKAAGVLSVRALSGGDEANKRGPDGTRKLLEDPTSDWTAVFGEPLEFKKLKDS